MSRIARLSPDEISLPAHLRHLAEDEQFRQELLEIKRNAREKMRAGPDPLARLTREDIRRARASALPEIIGVGPRRTPRGTGQG